MLHLDSYIRKNMRDNQTGTEVPLLFDDQNIDKHYNIYKVVRAFQAFLCLIHEPNYTLILRNSPHFVNQFCRYQ